MTSIEEQLQILKERFADPQFQRNQGLANEVGLYVFPYQPEEEMVIRAFIEDLKKNTGHQAFRPILYDLYTILLDICKKQRIIDRIPDLEEKKGQAFALRQIQNLATPEAFIEEMKYEDHAVGDIVIISGVGKVYPYMRSHNILNNLQHVFDDIPVVMFYPGQYTGQSLNLFGKFIDDHYYRAFNLATTRRNME